MRDLSHLPSLTPELLSGAAKLSALPVRFSLGDTSERERPAIYREFFGRSVVGIEVEPLGDMPFEVDVTLQSLPGLQLLSGLVHGSRNRRTRELLADGKGDFSLMVNLGGPYTVSQRNEVITLGDGEATLVSTAEPCSFTHHPPGDVLALRVPQERIGPLVTGVEDCCLRPIRRATPALRLLTDYVDMAWDRRTTASSALQHLFVAHVHDLMAVAIGATHDAAHAAQGRGLRAARLLAIKRDIAERLDQADLAVAALAHRHGCTPRFVQRLFETEGTTFTEYVLAQRLTRAHRRLSDLCRAREKISAVAYDCGFGDVSYFNRAFRRHFGAAPSDIRQRAAHHPLEFRDSGYDQIWSI